MMRLRVGERIWEMPESLWEPMVRSGRVPPQAMVISQTWTRGVWRRADTLEVYHLFLPSGAALSEVDGAGSAAGPEASTSGLPVAIWGAGISVTQVLLLLNLVISTALVWFWRDDYSRNLWHLSGQLKAALLQGWVPVLLIPLFLHVSAQHLMGNMLGLVAGGAAVEEFYGRARTLGMYLLAGLCGAGLSLLRTKPVLSVGASGAIMGLYGVILVFLLRYRGRFSERERIKTSRVYFPLLTLALLPSIVGADFYSHLGGFLGGALAGLLIRPPKDRLPWLRRTREGRAEEGA